MNNVRLVLKRDIKRLLHVHQTWIIVIGVVFTPALYAWFNIVAFWDPYSHTGNIKVAVVNEDLGGSTDLTGHVDAGAMIEAQLRENHQLGWQFMTEEQALRDVRSGAIYAAIVIPPEFTKDLLTVTSGDFTPPELRYYVNEKANAVAPKMTDAGATELDRQISAAFVEQIALAGTSKLQEVGSEADEQMSAAKTKTVHALYEAAGTIATVRGDVSTLNTDLVEARGKLSGTSATLEEVKNTLGDVQAALSQSSELIAEAQSEILSFTSALSDAYVQGATGLADAAAKADVALTKFTGVLAQASTSVDASIGQAQQITQGAEQAIGKIQEALDEADLPADVAAKLTQSLTTLQDKLGADQQILEALQTMNADTAGALKSIQDAGSALDSAASNAQSAAVRMNDSLRGSIPALSAALSELSTEAGAFSATLDTQIAGLTQAQTLLGNLDEQLLATSEALDSLDGNLVSIANGLGTAATDVSALGAAATWTKLREVADLDPAKIAQFVAAPVEVTENVVFPVDTYGSGMAALFTSLSLWIGAFALMVVFKVEVDEDGIPNLTVPQAYFARALLFSGIVAAQAIVVAVGDLIIGVQTVSALGFVATSVLVGLAYLGIIYALSVGLGHIGRGLCILLVIMQIPGSSGLYPIGMMPGFFRAIYPLLPFTYGINAMRETIAGFYRDVYWVNLGILAFIAVLSILIGLYLRRHLDVLNLAFNRRLGQTDLLIGERVEVLGRRNRLRNSLRQLLVDETEAPKHVATDPGERASKRPAPGGESQ